MTVFSPITLNSADTTTEVDPSILELSDGRFLALWRANDAGLDEDGDSNVKIWYRLLNQDGTFATAAQRLDVDDFGFQRAPEMAELSDGRIAIVWEHHGWGAPDYNIKSGIFSISDAGVLTIEGSVIDVNSTTVSSQRSPDVVALDDGKFAVVWKSYDYDASDGFSGYDIVGRVFDQSGATTPEVMFLSGDQHYDHEPKLAVLPDGNIVISWYNSSQNLTTGGTGEIIFAVHRNDGNYTQITQQTIAITDPWEQTGQQPEIAVDPLTGGFMLVWEFRDTTQVDSVKQIMAQRFYAHGAPISAPFSIVQTDNLDDEKPVATFLNDGRFVVLWRTDIVADSDYTMAGAIFGTDGSRVDFTYTANEEQFTAEHRVIATSDGGFAIIWNGYQGTTYTTDIMVQRFDHDGNPVAQGDWPDADIDQRLPGTGSGDIIQGGNANDTILGFGGNDQLSGQDGDDIILGGRGWDKIDGGAGDDFLRGQRGSDVIQGGLGNDTLHGNRGHDTLLGQDGLDTILGGRGHDSIDGGAGNDLIFGGSGADTIYGGDGYDDMFGGADRDHMYGGADDDEMHGNAGNDIMYGQDGYDEMYGGRGNDVMHGGAGSDIMHGGPGYDQLFGGAEQDIFIFKQGDGTTVIQDFSILEEDLIAIDPHFVSEAFLSTTEDGSIHFSVSQSEGWVEISGGSDMMRIFVRDHSDFVTTDDPDQWENDMLNYVEGAMILWSDAPSF